MLYGLFIGSVYLIPVVCSAIGLAGILAIALLVVFHILQRRKLKRSKAHAQYIEQRTNNENEETLRRYRNPLFANTTKSVDNKKQSKLEQELENIEKSPMHTVSNTDSVNESKTISPPKTKTKDINIELSRSRAKAAERQKELIEISKTMGVDLESEVMV